MRIITSPWRAEFNALVRSATKRVRVAAPFYSEEPVAAIQRNSKAALKCFLFTLDSEGVSANSQSVAAIRAIQKDKTAEVRFIKGLHAKLIVADEKAAIVTSSNLTRGGLERNFELGVRIDERKAVREVAREFDKHWNRAQPITKKKLKEFDAVPRQQRTGSKGPKAFEPRVSLGQKSSHPPALDTAAPGWILVHSQEAYAKSDWESPEEQLEKQWNARVGKLHWSWSSPMMNENATKRRVLLAWRQEVFGHAIATVEEGTAEDKKAGEPYFFVLTDYERNNRSVAFADLPLGKRRKHHRGLIRLDEEILAAYDRKLK